MADSMMRRILASKGVAGECYPMLQRLWHEGGDIRIGGRPEPHHPVVSWYRSDVKSTNSVYTDRMFQWDSKKYDELCRKHFGNVSQYWSDRKPEQIEAYLCDYLGKPVTLCLIQHEVNVSNGYPLWRFDYTEKEITNPALPL